MYVLMMFASKVFDNFSVVTLNPSMFPLTVDFKAIFLKLLNHISIPLKLED